MEGKEKGGKIKVIFGPMFSGKCLGVNTLVLMFDGTTKFVQHVNVRDTLVGDDLCPRIVESISSGFGKLYRIDLSDGSKYVVNSYHVLTLYNKESGKLEDIDIEKYVNTMSERVRLCGAKIMLDGKIVPLAMAVTRVEDGEFYGFMLTGNGRFLLGDRTVTHNTSELIRLIDRYRFGSKKCVIIKYVKDDRYDATKCCTHSGMKVDAIPRKTLLDFDCSAYDVLGIDEGQFFSDIVEFAEKQADAGKIVIIATLDGTSDGKPFGCVKDFVGRAEKFIKLTAICFFCGKTASFTICTKQKIGDELIGGAESYKAICRNCRKKYNKNPLKMS